MYRYLFALYTYVINVWQISKADSTMTIFPQVRYINNSHVKQSTGAIYAYQRDAMWHEMAWYDIA